MRGLGTLAGGLSIADRNGPAFFLQELSESISALVSVREQIEPFESLTGGCSSRLAQKKYGLKRRRDLNRFPVALVTP